MAALMIGRIKMNRQDRRAQARAGRGSATKQRQNTPPRFSRGADGSGISNGECDECECDGGGDVEGRLLKFRYMETGEIFTVRYWLDPEHGYSWQTRFQRGDHGTLAGGDGYGDQHEAMDASMVYLRQQGLLGLAALDSLSEGGSGGDATEDHERGSLPN
jgi:hypothetical protein